MQLEQMNLEQLQTEEKNLLSTHQQFLDSSLKLDPVSYTHLTLPTIE